VGRVIKSQAGGLIASCFPALAAKRFRREGGQAQLCTCKGFASAKSIAYRRFAMEGTPLLRQSHDEETTAQGCLPGNH